MKASCMKKHCASNLIQTGNNKKDSLLDSLYHHFLGSNDENNGNQRKLDMFQKKIIYDNVFVLEICVQ